MTKTNETNTSKLVIRTDYEGGSRNVSVEVSGFSDTGLSSKALLLETIRMISQMMKNEKNQLRLFSVMASAERISSV